MLVLDPISGELPESLGSNAIASTTSSLAIGTLSEFDGETEVYFAELANLPAESELVRRWTGTLNTSGRLAICTVDSDVLLSTTTPKAVEVEVWSNDPSEPDAIWLLFSEAGD
ncbi:hypothetical protein [Agromyces sp. NPDC058064]|uniref:hypothetical protein n=1 Tax=Agromyces sp. NPDC058064 TaxID=3346322 RepID=UPI0036D813D4